MYEGKRILVTGGAGFLGSQLVKRLGAEAKKVTVLDDLFTGRRDVLPKSERVEFVHGSVTDAALIRQLLAQVDVVFHFAARNIVLSTVQPESDFRVNVEGTVQLLLNAMSFPQIERIVIASTSSIYGNAQNLPIREEGYDASVPYSASKLAAEVLAIAYARTYGLPVTCLRFSNVYGPGQVATNPYCGVVSKFITAIKEHAPLVIYGDGTQTRDFTYVDDAMTATLLAGVSPNTLGEVLNVGTGIETSVNHLADLVGQVAGVPKPSVVNLQKRSVDTIYRRSIDAQKLRDKTGWKPQYSLAQGLAKTYNWFLQNEEW